MTRRFAVTAALVLLGSLLAVPIAAQEEPTFLVLGKWIGNEVVGYCDKVIDTLTGNDRKVQAVGHLWVLGRNNEIWIEESAGDEQFETFTISDVGSRLRFRLRPDTGAVIHVTGDDNRFYIPSELLRRVRVANTGRNNWTVPVPANP